MTNVQWAVKLGVPARMVWQMGGAAHLEAMTELGREIYVAVWLRQPGDTATKAAVTRIGLDNRLRRKQLREDVPLRRRREHLLRRMRGHTASMVWLGCAGLKKPPVRWVEQRDVEAWRAQGWHPSVVQALEQQERKVG